jgi:hypothetical protein
MYEITRVEDVSRPRCKRFVGNVVVTDNPATSDEIKTIIVNATKDIKNAHDPCHVVRLYIHTDIKLRCQSMWVDKTFTDAPLPLPLKYNDSVGDIGIVW